MSPLSDVPGRRLIFAVLLAILVLPLGVEVVDAQSSPSPVLDEARDGGADLELPGKPGGGVPDDPDEIEGDPDDYGCGVPEELMRFLLAEVYILIKR